VINDQNSHAGLASVRARWQDGSTGLGEGEPAPRSENVLSSDIGQESGMSWRCRPDQTMRLKQIAWLGSCRFNRGWSFVFVPCATDCCGGAKPPA